MGRRTDEQRELAIGQIISRAVVSDSVVDIFGAVGLNQPNIALLDSEFVAQVCVLTEKNLNVELLERRLWSDIKAKFASRAVLTREFPEMLATIALHCQKALSNDATVRYLYHWDGSFQPSWMTATCSGDSMASTTAYTRLLAGTTMACLTLGLLAGCATPAPTQSVSLLEPVNGATVSTTFKVRFGVNGMKVAPAGEIIANSGHNHLLINQMPVPTGESVPFDEQHKHFGAGQTEAMVTLPPGQYKLTSQFANGAHQSYGSPMSSTIQITVK